MCSPLRKNALRRRSVLGIGALAAAGLATLTQKSIGLGFGCTRCQLLEQVTPPAWLVAPAHVLHRSQSTLSSLFAPLSSISGSSDSSAMAALTPPQAAPKWTHSPEDVRRIAKESIDKHRQLVDKISVLPPDECNFESVRCKLLSI